MSVTGDSKPPRICQRCTELIGGAFLEGVEPPGTLQELNPESCEICSFFMTCIPPAYRDSGTEFTIRWNTTYSCHCGCPTRKLVRTWQDEPELEYLTLEVQHEPWKWFYGYLIPTGRLVELNKSHRSSTLILFTLGAITDLQLTVIDCNTSSLVSIPDGVAYVTPSYVWGRSDTTELNPGRGAILKLNDLPQTMKDVISVCLSLGFRYLWVDRYCIPQADLEQRTRQIQRMDNIYAESALTLVSYMVPFAWFQRRMKCQTAPRPVEVRPTKKRYWPVRSYTSLIGNYISSVLDISISALETSYLPETAFQVGRGQAGMKGWLLLT
ncbi:hypothetical protein BU23DRAFT_562968 [Bimuria novae-zelandiae CBS 107.79]|uniref:Heterokaryon incompatibility domain-containing protein n=1 Tax=Bimuria novae-zelandiae CBS 107.79 TaxID=1447943 RepID=A0A6A5W296_9PLEO|nr:hypothetical protein BU23DRAFT_562968 [Bimuria novae-zelandiae CBS 107.79]